MSVVESDDTTPVEPAKATKRTSAKPANKPAKDTKAKRNGNKRKKQKPQIVIPTPVAIETAAETTQSPISRELPGTAVDTGALLTGILETPRPEFAISTEEEENILTLETLPPITPFDIPLDTPYPDNFDELEVTASPFDTELAEPEANVETAIPAEPETSIETPNPPETEISVEMSTLTETETSIEATNPVEAEISIESSTPPETETNLEASTSVETEAPIESTAQIDTKDAMDAEVPIDTPALIDSGNSVAELIETEDSDVGAAEVAVVPEKRPATEQRQRQLRAVLILVSLALFLTSSLLFWQDVSSTHLYVSSLNPSDGRTLTQVDMGSGYSGDAVLAPVMGQSSVFFGIASSQQASLFQQNGTSWQQTKQFSAPLTHGTLSVTPQGNLVIESEQGLEVTTFGGQLLWRMTGDQPAQGVHAFQPAFDSDTLYTVKAAATGEIAAYDLHNGVLRWTAHLHDTLNYAPPLLLAGTTLYVAGDHTIFALNSSDGRVLWTAPHAARTLLLSGSGAHQLLIAASADGLLALNASDGSPVWTFHGQVGPMTTAGVLSLSQAQFYQASTAGNTIFATGIAWKAPLIQPELWLYALDAATGNMRWSREIATSTISADTGRIFTPMVDSAQHLVILEQQQDSTTLSIAAFDASSGQPRWQSQFQGVSATSSSLLEPSHNALLFISLQTDSGIALRTMTLVRLLLLATMLLSILGLLLLLLYPWHIQQPRYQQALHSLTREQLTPAWKAVRSRRSLRKLPVIALLVVLLAACVAGYAQLNQAQESVSLLDIHSGATRWQHTAPSTEALAANAQGSIISAAVSANMHRVQAIDTNGALRWQSFASAGTFSVPAVPTQPGTLLLALSGHLPMHYAFAPTDPAYPPPLDSLLILSLLNRNTGQPLWQSAIVNPGDQQSAAVIGADAHFIYLASLQTNPPTGSGAAMQLLAVDKSSGLVTWRVFGPLEPPNTSRDNGTLLLQGRRILWQIEGAVYAIDSLTGQIGWHRTFGSDNAHTLLQEEGQLAETNGLLLVARSTNIYAIDPASSNVLWTIPVPGPANLQSASSLTIDGNTLLIYNNGQIEAIDLTNQHLIWTRKLLSPATTPASAITPTSTTTLAPATNPVGAEFILRSADLSANNGQIYVTLNASNGPMLIALDSKTGATLWRFQPSGQATFTSIIQNQNTLLAALCAPTSGTQACSHETLYALNATTGAVNWQQTATSISHIEISPDGAAVLLQKDGSAWQQLWHV